MTPRLKVTTKQEGAGLLYGAPAIAKYLGVTEPEAAALAERVAEQGGQPDGRGL